ncbi:MAG TPA: hypothetical protein VF765_21015 [Polyangiaceae bacterium]
MPERAVTERPPFDVERYARESEEIEVAPDSRRATEPPPPEHTNLRESCRDLRAALAPLASEHVSDAQPLTYTPALGAVVVPLLSPEDYEWFELDDRARSIIAIVDDQLIVEEILAATHTSIPDGIALFTQLATLGLVAFRAA